MATGSDNNVGQPITVYWPAEASNAFWEEDWPRKQQVEQMISHWQQTGKQVQVHKCTRYKLMTHLSTSDVPCLLSCALSHRPSNAGPQEAHRRQTPWPSPTVFKFPLAVSVPTSEWTPPESCRIPRPASLPSHHDNCPNKTHMAWCGPWQLPSLPGAFLPSCWANSQSPGELSREDCCKIIKWKWNRMVELVIDIYINTAADIDKQRLS